MLLDPADAKGEVYPSALLDVLWCRCGFVVADADAARRTVVDLVIVRRALVVGRKHCIVLSVVINQVRWRVLLFSRRRSGWRWVVDKVSVVGINMTMNGWIGGWNRRQD